MIRRAGTLGRVVDRGLLQASRPNPGPVRCAVNRHTRPTTWPEPLLQAARATVESEVEQGVMLRGASLRPSCAVPRPAGEGFEPGALFDGQADGSSVEAADPCAEVDATSVSTWDPSVVKTPRQGCQCCRQG